MIHEAKEKAVAALIELGLPERQIAEKAGVSRGTVRSRKHGYRGSRPQGTVARQPPSFRATPANDRCPICHARLTEFPCRACVIRGDWFEKTHE